MRSIGEVRAVPGQGLEGDRYGSRTGTYSHRPAPDRDVTLIEIEAIEALTRDYGIALDAKDSRRNIATRGGAAQPPGEPRVQGRGDHPAGPAALRPLFTEGTIRVGDPVQAE
jgi:hypothetical protein